MRLSAAALLIALALPLGGCAEAVVASVSSLMTTGKTVPDQVISLAARKDCSVLRRQRGRTYCREDEPNPAPNVYCFNNLGGIECYSRPVDPTGLRRTVIGQNDHNYTQKW